MITLSPARSNEIERLIAIHSASFPNPLGFPERRANFMDNPRGPLSDLHVARNGKGDIVGHGFLFRTRTFILGGEVQVGAVASVGVASEARGGGVARALLHGLLDESERRGDALQLLYPFSYAFYASLGFGHVSPLVRLRTPCRSLPHRGEGKRCRRATTDDNAAIAVTYAAAAARENGLITRSDAVFAKYLNAPGVMKFVVEGELGLRGYVSFVFVERHDVGEVELHVRELVALDDDARRALIGVVAAHRDQVTNVELTLLPDDPLPMLVEEPRAPREPFVPGHLHPLGALAAGPMVRAVDVRSLLLSRGYRNDGALDLRVVDPRKGTIALRLEVRDGVGKASESPSGSEHALEVDVGAFSSIAVGALRPSDASRHGRLHGSPASLAVADRLFATGAPFRCLDEF